MRLRNIFFIALTTIALASCGSHKKVAYMQDAVFNQENVILNVNDIKIQPQDKLNILVTCKEPQLANLFNLVENRRRLGQSGNGTNNTGNTASYTVDSQGNIDFPVVGTIHIGGLTREQVAAKIKNLLISENLISDPVVTVEFENLHYSVLGEVGKPGTYAITDDNMTLLQALANAGDLTITGKRDRVYVIREENGKRIKYNVDLRSDSLFDSPAYYLQQNDVIYVEPNDMRAGQATVNENNWKSVGLWISIASFLMSAAVLIFR